MIRDTKIQVANRLMMLEESVLAILFEQPDLRAGEISKRLDITNDDYTYLNRS